MATYRIITLDGGGIRGVITATILERLLETFPDLIAKADLLGGTSTGGILALGLAKGLTPTELKELYIDKGDDIFDDSIWDDIVDLGKIRGADYDNKKLRRILRQTLGPRTRLSNLRKRVVIPTFDLDNRDNDPAKRCWKPKIFHNFPGRDTDGGMEAWRVALYTTAAPTYFPSVDGYVDGGVFANNPGMVALAQTQDSRTHRSAPAFRDIRLLSLGTGTALEFISGRRHDWGYVQWVKPLINLMMDGVMGIADYQCKQILGAHYHRLAPVFPPGKNYPLDDVDRTEEMVQFATSSVRLNETTDWLQSAW